MEDSHRVLVETVQHVGCAGSVTTCEYVMPLARITSALISKGKHRNISVLLVSNRNKILKKTLRTPLCIASFYVSHFAADIHDLKDYNSNKLTYIFRLKI